MWDAIMFGRITGQDLPEATPLTKPHMNELEPRPAHVTEFSQPGAVPSILGLCLYMHARDDEGGKRAAHQLAISVCNLQVT